MENIFRKIVDSLNLCIRKRLDRSIAFYRLRITEKNKRVLRIIKDIIGEKNMDFRSEQILIDLIENKDIKD